MNIDFNLLDDIEKSSALEDETQSAVDKLLVLQTRKVEMLQQRDALQAKKTELAEAIDRLNATWSDYEQQSRQHETREKLEYYLHQNDHEFAKLAAADGAASFVLDNLNVLPAKDWALRLALVGRFFPHMAVGPVLSGSYVEKSTLVTTMAYSMSARGLPTFQMVVHVQNEAVCRLEIANWEHVAWTLRKISPTFSRAVKTNFLRRNKVDLVMYGYHSLARLQHKRIEALTAILNQHPDWVVRPAHDWKIDAYSALATVPYIELDLALTGHAFHVRLHWELHLQDSVTAAMESQLELVVIGEESGVVANANEVFLGLVPQHGVVRAFEVMLANVFGVD